MQSYVSAKVATEFQSMEEGNPWEWAVRSS